MSRAHKLFGIATTLVVLWFVAILTLTGYWREIALSMPTYGLVLFGSHSFYSIGRGLAQLKDYPEEAESLRQEVQKAQVFYKSMGLQL